MPHLQVETAVLLGVGLLLESIPVRHSKETTTLLIYTFCCDLGTLLVLAGTVLLAIATVSSRELTCIISPMLLLPR